MSILTQKSEVAGFTVTIVACGPCPPSAATATPPSSSTTTNNNNASPVTAPATTTSVVYAVTVTQPVQSWTVLRSHSDFQNLRNAVVSTSFAESSLPFFPGLSFLLLNSNHNSSSTSDTTVAAEQQQLDALIQTRHALQDWLSALLMHSHAHTIPSVSSFLTLGANMIPTQYERVVWTQFSPSPVHTINSSANLSLSSLNSNNNNTNPGVNFDDMEMDDMFLGEDEIGSAPHHDDHHPHQTDFDEASFIPAASIRYKPTDEAFTDEEEMEILNLAAAGEVEMIEDIGTLVQSLGASHLGRSLQLQAEMKFPNYKSPYTSNVTAIQSSAHHQQPGQQQQPLPGGGGLLAAKLQQQQGGVSIGGSRAPDAPPSVGGLGGAMERAAFHNNNVAAATAAHFNHKPPVSAPRLDSFKMIKVIGKGSFGKVFLVKEIKTGEIFALKVLRKDNIIKRNQVEHTNTERSVLGYVRHPFIVGMNMAFQSKDKLYFVLDYCAGGELFFHLGKLGKFPENRSRFYAAEIILAISYVHSLDIIYRDLKPENVLLDAQGHIRLTDFGLSKEGISNSSSGANSFCGTPEYLAPEILNRQGHGRAVDWWSLGALLYEMITGLPPFYCQDRERLFEKIRRSELHYPPSVSRPAKKVLVGLLTKDPVRRLGSGPTDADEIKEKEFFNELNFDKLMNGEIQAPWKPTITGSLDTSQFDKEFTKMPMMSPQSMQRTHGFGTTPDESLFQGFTFTDRKFHGAGAQAGI